MFDEMVGATDKRHAMREHEHASGANGPMDADMLDDALDDAVDDASDEAFDDALDDALDETPGDVNVGEGVVDSDADSVAPRRMHLVFALVAGFALIALPLVMWVNPDVVSRGGGANETELADSPVLPGSSADSVLDEVVDDEPAKSDSVKLGDVWIDKCEKPGPGKTSPEQCDSQPWFEQALQRAIRENAACAPERSGTLSVVMRIDHARRQLDVFAGKSGAIRGKAAQGLIACVQRSVPEPPWDSLEHDHTKYIMAVMVTYGAKN